MPTYYFLNKVRYIDEPTYGDAWLILHYEPALVRNLDEPVQG